MIAPPSYSWHPRLMCRLNFIDIDRDHREAVVHIAPGECTDMTGCIKTVQQHLPDVKRITVLAGDELDIWYCRDSEGWQAWLPMQRGLMVTWQPNDPEHPQPIAARYGVPVQETAR
jgi:hypothetical protein